VAAAKRAKEIQLAEQIGFIGCGNMGSALLAQFTQAQAAAQFFVYDADAAKAAACASAYKAAVCASADELAEKCGVVIAAVKPQQMREALAPLRGALAGKVLVSVAAGIPLATLAERAPKARIIRVMPNTPVQLGAGVCAWAAANAREEDIRTFTALFAAGGLLFRLDEGLMDAFTALAGSGPAYVFMLIRGLTEAGVREGLHAQDALIMTAQTFLGAARMVLELGEAPEVLQARVTSPGGTTEAGLAVLEARGVRQACMEAVTAARARAEELGRK